MTDYGNQWKPVETSRPGGRSEHRCPESRPWNTYYLLTTNGIRSMSLPNGPTFVQYLEFGTYLHIVVVTGETGGERGIVETLRCCEPLIHGETIVLRKNKRGGGGRFSSLGFGAESGIPSAGFVYNSRVQP